MIDFTYTISDSTEMNRREIRFVSSAALTICALSRVSRAGGRRDALGVTTHYVFPPEVECNIVAAVEQARVREVSTHDRAADANASAISAQAAKAEFMRIASAAKRLLSKKRKAEIDAVKVSITVRISQMYNKTEVITPQYVPAVSKALRAEGGRWESIVGVWYFEGNRVSELSKILPKLNRAAARYIADLAAGRVKKYEPRVYSDYSDQDLMWMSDDGLTSQIGMSAAQVRRELKI